ncbi:hypothetical protein [Oceanobacter kriegii]|uniref:hypothetical protein n=1 Tax=Oceanobacter kriegii TaxID=64972 RepID=UPI0003F54BE5|nr:hypothetical protein [Oceanobacter kriegii]
MPYATVHPPIPVQTELVPPCAEDVLSEYRAAFHDQSVLLPELAVRYLLWQIVSDVEAEELKSFAFMIRNELNEQRALRFGFAS